MIALTIFYKNPVRLGKAESSGMSLTSRTNRHLAVQQKRMLHMKSIRHSWTLGISIAVIMFLVSIADAEAKNFALSFSDSTTSPQIGVAPLVTTETDNVVMDIWLKWAGPIPGGTLTGVQTPVYNGNSRCTGWGIALVNATGEVAILSGGVRIIRGNVFLTPVQWQQVRRSGAGEFSS